MSYTITHSPLETSSTGYCTVLTKDGSTVQIDSILNDDLTVNETASKKVVLENYTKNVSVALNQPSVFSAVDGSQALDTVYMNGSVTRTDRSVGTTQGQSIVTRLNETWPDEVSSYTANSINLVGEYTPSRPPYNANETLSFYDFDGPTTDIKTRFGATYQEYMSWYGLKFDTVTENVLAKFVIPMNEMERVDSTTYNAIMNILPPSCGHFFARIHDKSGTVDNNVDVYFFADPELMEDWCSSVSLTFPYDTTDTTISSKIFIWSLVYNTTTETVSHVKAYTRETV